MCRFSLCLIYFTDTPALRATPLARWELGFVPDVQLNEYTRIPAPSCDCVTIHPAMGEEPGIRQELIIPKKGGLLVCYLEMIVSPVGMVSVSITSVVRAGLG